MTSVTRQIPYGSSPPASWNVVPLKRLVALFNGYVFKSDSWEDTGTPILRIENLNGSETFNHSSLELSEKHRVASGDLLFSWSGNPGTSFGPFRWEKSGLYYLNQHIFKVDVRACDKNWLYWSLKAATYWIERELTSGMIGMVHVTKEELGNVPICLPPLSEQRRIADFLDAETARIDKLVSLRGKQLDLIVEKFISESIRLTGRMRVVGACEPKEGVVPLRRAVSSVRTGLTPTDLQGSSDVSRACTSLPWYTPSVIDGWMEVSAADKFSHRRRDVPVFLAGSVLVTGIGESLGKVAYLEHEATGNQQLTSLFPESRINGKFLAWQLWAAEPEIREWAQYSRIRIINNDSLNSFPIFLPSRDEQDSTVRVLDARLVHVNQLKSAIHRFQSLANERRQALITAAVTGQFDVSTASGRNVTDGVQS